ncbi:MAG: transposon-transfer assisting family protein [Oscillospiraceae bacterium]|nr:transposon-transfer assisting family protein [Oscillospiraceae bacterium]
MMTFTHDELNLMCIYDTGTRTGLLEALSRMKAVLEVEETELRELTDTVIEKLSAMSDAEYAELELFPDFDEEDMDGK